MGLIVNYGFNIYDSPGSQIIFVDTTPDNSVNTPYGYNNPNISRSSVSQIRLLIANYPAIQGQQLLASGSPLTQYEMYQKTKGTPSVYDGKTISVGNFFVPPVSGLSVLSGDEFQDTGSYVKYTPPSLFLPTTNTTELILSITDLGLSASNQTVPDYVFNTSYEVYGVATSTPFTAVLGQQYIVVGTSGHVTYNSNMYRPGEIFIGNGVNSVTFSGGSTAAAKVSKTEKVFITTYNLEMSAYQLNVNSQTKQSSKNIQPKINRVYNLIESLKFSEFTEDVSFQKATDLIQLAQTQIDQLNAC